MVVGGACQLATGAITTATSFTSCPSWCYTVYSMRSALLSRAIEFLAQKNDGTGQCSAAAVQMRTCQRWRRGTICGGTMH